MKAILKVSFVIIGTMIGAGFASGQEIFLFFNQYGSIGSIGLIFSCILTGVLIHKVFCLMKQEEIEDYDIFLKKVNPNPIIYKTIKIMISLFLLFSFYIMIAGMSAYFKQQFGISTWITSIVMSMLCYFTLQKDMKGIMLVNYLLIPCLILFIFYLGTKNLDFTIQTIKTQEIQFNQFPHWLISSILYASYNSILLFPILIELKTYFTSYNQFKKTSIFCTIILTILGICLFYLLETSGSYLKQVELPMIEVTRQFGSMYPYIYGGVIIVAIFTSAISAGYGFLKNQSNQKSLSINQQKKKYKNWLIGICILAPVIANFGFANLVSLLYPIFGILGLLQIYGILKVQFNKKYKLDFSSVFKPSIEKKLKN